MKKFPKPEIYEQFFEFSPWGILINKVVSVIQKEVPQNSTVLDLMCGTGFLLGEICKRRSDLTLEGIDLNDDFIQYAKSKYPSISVQVADILVWNPTKKYDLVLCTGGLHHLTFDKRESVLERASHFLNANGIAIFADPYLDDFSNEVERKQAAAKLGYEYLKSTIEMGAAKEAIEATIDILYNDVLGLEFKTSIKKIEPVLRKYFNKVEINKTWQENESQFGDYYIICKQ
jgi:trans-aconitate methyltransferase